MCSFCSRTCSRGDGLAHPSIGGRKAHYPSRRHAGWLRAPHPSGHGRALRRIGTPKRCARRSPHFNISCSEQKRRANIRSDTLLIDRLLFSGKGTPEPYKVKPRIRRSVGKVAAISSPNLVTPVTDFLEQSARRLRMRGNIFSRLHGGVLWLPKLNSPA